MCQLASDLEIPYNTLKDRIENGATSIAERQPPNLKLTNEQNDALLRFIRLLYNFGVPLRVKHIGTAALSILSHSHVIGTKEIPKIGEHWVQRWLKRHKNIIKIKTHQAIELERLNAQKAETFENFYALFAEIRRKFEIRNECIFNMDEMGIRVGVGRAKWFVTPYDTKDNTSKDSLPSLGETDHCTLVECIAADGTVLPPLIILIGKLIQSSWFENLPEDYLLGVSESGYINDVLFFHWVQHFDRFTRHKLRKKDEYRLLMLDGHGSHISYEAAQFCWDNRIKLLQLPPHSTHIIQPLDVGCFQPWKHHHSEAIDEYIRQGDGQIDGQDFLDSISYIRGKTFTINTIKSSFRKTGFIPFDPDKIVNHFVFNESQRQYQGNSEPPSSPNTLASFAPVQSFRGVKRQSERLKTHQKSPKFTSNLDKLTTNLVDLEAQKRRKRSKKSIQKRGVVYAADVKRHL